MTILEHLIEKIRVAASFNSVVQAQPACVLWTDPDSQWSSAVPDLLSYVPELFILGSYEPSKRTGPAIWLRCVLEGKIDDIEDYKGITPIFYLPGVSRQALRDVRSCPNHLLQLVELQYRGTVWTQVNSKDWTILAFLKSSEGGLGLDVSQDSETKTAMQLALRSLLNEDVEILRGKQLGKDYFNTLLTGGDPVRDLLMWIDSGDSFREEKDLPEWKAFVSVCKSNYGFDPQKEGVIAGAAKLASREGPWKAVWARYCESPRRYPNIPGRIATCTPPAFDLFSDAESAGGWPQWNETQEKVLASDLNGLERLPEHEARQKIVQLEKQHADRRSLVWAELGMSPLARAVEHLSALVGATENKMNAGTLDDVAAVYRLTGWRADDAVLKALSMVEKAADLYPIAAAIQSIYKPWAENAARHLQQIVDGSTYPGIKPQNVGRQDVGDNECIVFVDGLRFDLAKRLAELLRERQYTVSETPVWAALPSVTATGKPAVSPVRHKVVGTAGASDFEPKVASTGQSLRGGYHFKKLLADEGWLLLSGNDSGSGQGRSWCEVGDIDHEGHDRGWKLARHIGVLLNEIRDKIEGLLEAGWTTVRVVTDHGWLLLPGGLPKIHLPAALAESKWGRCAAIKAGAITNERLYPWYWDPNERFALADGISCFKGGMDYAHGGLSFQECFNLELVIRRASGLKAGDDIRLSDIVWRGQRCSVKVQGAITELFLDIRTAAGDPSTSVAEKPKPLSEEGTGSVVVEDVDLVGEDAYVILVNAEGDLTAQALTRIGGEGE